jgi:hypothetical protein
VKVPRLPAAVEGDLGDLHPRWAGNALKEFLVGVAVHMTVQDLRPVHDVGQNDRSDLPVIVDQVTLCVATFRPKDLGKVGQVEGISGGKGGLP